MGITKSKELLKRANRVIPGQTNTISKRYGRLPQGIAPAYLSHGTGCRVYDVDDNEYIDWSASLGSVVLGYGLGVEGINPILPLPEANEVELAEKLVDIIPCAEMVRFFKTGSDACTAAMMLAKKVTGRGPVVSTGYHGWHDWGFTPIEVEYGNLDGLEDVFDKYLGQNTPAAYILEPMDRSCPEKCSMDFLVSVRKLCDKYNVILIFDEILTGFRYGLVGIQGGYDKIQILPDLACYGKAMSNGYPLSALVGKREIMENLKDMKISGTYYSEALSIESALYTINVMERENVTDYLWEKGEYLNKQIKDLIFSQKFNKMVELKGFGPWSSFVWSEDRWDEEQLFLQEIFKRGIFYNRDHFIMFSHESEDIERTLDVYHDAFDVVKEAMDRDIVKEKLVSKVDRKLVK